MSLNQTQSGVLARHVALRENELPDRFFVLKATEGDVGGGVYPVTYDYDPAFPDPISCAISPFGLTPREVVVALQVQQVVFWMVKCSRQNDIPVNARLELEIDVAGAIRTFWVEIIDATSRTSQSQQNILCRGPIPLGT